MIDVALDILPKALLKNICTCSQTLLFNHILSMYTCTYILFRHVVKFFRTFLSVPLLLRRAEKHPLLFGFNCFQLLLWLLYSELALHLTRELFPGSETGSSSYPNYKWFWQFTPEFCHIAASHPATFSSLTQIYYAIFCNISVVSIEILWVVWPLAIMV